MRRSRLLWDWIVPGVVTFAVLLAFPPAIRFAIWYLSYWGF